jgi:hypothetical protein
LYLCIDLMNTYTDKTNTFFVHGNYKDFHVGMEM